MMKNGFILFALLCRQLTVFAQFTVSGTVYDENKMALSGANVTIEKTFRGTTTDAQGEYNLSVLKTGIIVVKVSFLGYEPHMETIEVNGNVRADFKLERNVLLADEVVVVATKAGRNTPVAQTNLTKDNIREQNQGQDIPYLLSLTPSLVTSSDAGAGVGYTSFRIRGTDLSRINVTVNGIPLNDAESHGVWWVDLPDFSSSVNNIQIQRGVGTSSLGAGAFGASINLQTFNLNKDAYGEINSAYGSFNTFKNTVNFGTGLIKDHFTFDARLSKITSDGFIDRASSDLKSFHLSGAYYDKKNILKFNIISGTEKTYQAWNGVPSVKMENDKPGMEAYVNTMASWGYIRGDAKDLSNIYESDSRQYNLYNYSNQTDNYQQDYYMLQYSREINEWLNFNTSLHYTRGKGYYEEFKPNSDLEDYKLQPVVIKDSTISASDLIRRKWLDNDFYGITYSFNYLKGKTTFNMGGGWNNYYGEHYGNVIWSQYAGNSNINHQYYYADGNKSDFSIFWKVSYEVTKQLSVFADFQYRQIVHDIKGEDDDHREITQKHSYFFRNPKAGLNYKIDNSQSVYAFWGVANREPTRSNFVDADPSKPLPTSEKLFDYELGYDISMEKVKANVNFYYMDYMDQLVLTGEINDVGTGVMTNVPRSYRAGIEISLAVQPVKQLSWNGNLTLSRNKIKHYIDHIDNYNYWNDPENEPLQFENNLGETNISFSPDIIVSSQFQYKPLETLSVSFNSKYVGKQFIDNTSNDDNVLKPYFVNDLRFNKSFKIRKLINLETIFSVNNIFNEEYETNAWLYQYIEATELKKVDGFFPQAGRNYMVSLIMNF